MDIELAVSKRSVLSLKHDLLLDIMIAQLLLPIFNFTLLLQGDPCKSDLDFEPFLS